MGRPPKKTEKELRKHVMRKERDQRRRAAGLDRSGRLKPGTSVLLDHLPKNSTFYKSEVFGKVPFALLGVVPPAARRLLNRLRQIEMKIRAMYLKGEIELTREVIGTNHRYGANVGVNAGNSKVSGGYYGDRNKGISGSIHMASMVKGDPKLRNEIIKCIRGIIIPTLGEEAWFKKQMELCERLNEESGEPRTVPGLPFSALWLTMNPKEDNVHCDENVCGCTILFTTQSFKGSELVAIQDPHTSAQTRTDPVRQLGEPRALQPQGGCCRVSNLMDAVPGLPCVLQEVHLCVSERVRGIRFHGAVNR
jgi:hypothetical protein